MTQFKNTPRAKHNEFIVAVKAEYLTDYSGYIQHTNYDELVMFLEPHVVISQRHGLETNTNYLQLLPYIYFFQDTSEGRKYYVYERTKTVGEIRLSGKQSIGIGGHVEFCDVVAAAAEMKNPPYAIPLLETLEETIYREIREETDIKNFDFEIMKGGFKGFIVDRGDEVGKVHVGLIFGVDVKDVADPESFNVVDMDLSTIGFRKIEEVQINKCERWTRIIFDQIQKDSEKEVMKLATFKDVHTTTSKLSPNLKFKILGKSIFNVAEIQFSVAEELKGPLIFMARKVFEENGKLSGRTEDSTGTLFVVNEELMFFPHIPFYFKPHKGYLAPLKIGDNSFVMTEYDETLHIVVPNYGFLESKI